MDQKDADGRDVFRPAFSGSTTLAFLSLEAIAYGRSISQSDVTASMAIYSLNLMRIALDLACVNPVYEDIANKFFEHFLFPQDRERSPCRGH